MADENATVRSVFPGSAPGVQVTVRSCIYLLKSAGDHVTALSTSLVLEAFFGGVV